MGNAIGDQKLTIFRCLVFVVSELENGMTETRVDLIAERIPLKQVIATPDIKWQFGDLFDLLLMSKQDENRKNSPQYWFHNLD